MAPASTVLLGMPPQPEPLDGGFDGIYANVAKLEEQQASDRAFVADLARAVRALQANFGTAHRRLESVEADLNNPRRDFTVRQEMRDMRAKLEADMVNGHETLHNTMGPRLAELQGALTEVQVTMANFRDKEVQIEAYLTSLENERPREGQKVVTGFEFVQNEIISVKEMVRRLESQPRGTPFTTTASALTEEMQLSIAGTQRATEENTRGLFELSVNVANIGMTGTHTQGRVTALEHGIQHLVANLNEQQAKIDTAAQHTKVNMVGAFSGQSTCSASCGDHGGAANAGPFAIPPMRTPPGGDGGSGFEARLRACIGGNGLCHCEHVERLKEKMAELEN